MATEVDRVRDEMATMKADIAAGKMWMAVHDVSCAARYKELRDSMTRQNRLLMYATGVLGLIAVGLKSKFGEELMRVMGLL